MRRVGTWMLVFGVLDFLLPRFGYDLKWFESLGAARDWVAVGLLVIGAGLIVLGWREQRTARTIVSGP